MCASHWIRGWLPAAMLFCVAGCDRSADREFSLKYDAPPFESALPVRYSEPPRIVRADDVSPPNRVEIIPQPLPELISEPVPKTFADVVAGIDVAVAVPRPNDVITSGVYTDLRGSFTGELPRDAEVFVVAEEPSGFYLMYPPATVSRKTGEYYQANIRLATVGAWRLHVCLADAAAAGRLHDLAAASQWHLPRLPEGVEIMATTPVRRIEVEPLAVTATWHPSGWMGDGEVEGALKHSFEFDDGPGGGSYERWTYDPEQGHERWVAVSYQIGSFGDQPGKDLRDRGFRRISFRIRGDEASAGREVRFISGGHTAPDAEHPASYETDSLSVTLRREWTRHSLRLDGRDLSNTVAALVFVVDQVREQTSFDLADIRFEGDERRSE